MRVITCVYSNVVHKHTITRGSHKNASFTNIHSFQVFIRMNLKMRNILLGVTTNTLGFDGVTLTNVSLLPSCNAPVGIYCSLPCISVFSDPCSRLQRMCIVLLWFNANAMTGCTIHHILKHCVLLTQKLWLCC